VEEIPHKRTIGDSSACSYSGRVSQANYNFLLLFTINLGGDFKLFCSSLFGKTIQFDDCAYFFQLGGKKPPTRKTTNNNNNNYAVFAFRKKKNISTE